MTVDELFGHVQKYHKHLKRKLKDGTYNPLPVKRVEIPKPDGSKRKLGIPCVRDRMVQQAIYQVIGGIIDPHFSERSYGFRPNRNQHQAIEQSIKYYEQGYKVVVELKELLRHHKSPEVDGIPKGIYTRQNSSEVNLEIS